MTANEDALVVDLDAIDLFEITDKWLQTCPSCDAGLPATCTHPADDYRNVVSDLVDALAFARAEIDRLRSRASIGPDSTIEINDADREHGVDHWIRTASWWSNACREAWAARDGLIAEVARLRSIDPDSERIRELEAENAKLRQAMRTYGR